MYMWAYAMCLYSARCKRDDSDDCKTRMHAEYLRVLRAITCK